MRTDKNEVLDERFKLNLLRNYGIVPGRRVNMLWLFLVPLLLLLCLLFFLFIFQWSGPRALYQPNIPIRFLKIASKYRMLVTNMRIESVRYRFNILCCCCFFFGCLLFIWLDNDIRLILRNLMLRPFHVVRRYVRLSVYVTIFLCWWCVL